MSVALIVYLSSFSVFRIHQHRENSFTFEVQSLDRSVSLKNFRSSSKGFFGYKLCWKRCRYLLPPATHIYGWNSFVHCGMWTDVGEQWTPHHRLTCVVGLWLVVWKKPWQPDRAAIVSSSGLIFDINCLFYASETFVSSKIWTFWQFRLK